MKNLKYLLAIGLLIGIAPTTNAQLLKKLSNRAKQTVERTVNKRVDKETSKKTDEVLDDVLESNKKDSNSNKNETETYTDVNTTSAINYNYDFQPGSIPIFSDTFTNDLPGDFPAKWDTNGSGEIVIIEGQKWFRLGNKSTFIPMVNGKLPENYSIEFDLFTKGLDKETSSNAFLILKIENTADFSKSHTYSLVDISPCQFINSPGYIAKYNDGKRQLWNAVGKDYRVAINGKSKISIAVNKTRMRVWINENKIVDVPRLVPENADYFKLVTTGLRDSREKDELYIGNFKIAEAENDHRSDLITKGKLSTNAILFNTASASIKSGAEAILQEVAVAMIEVPSMKIKIVGHTDADGSTDANLKLSKNRANAVKQALVVTYGIASNRILTDGKGESEPVANNESTDGKAQNRRVEFIRL